MKGQEEITKREKQAAAALGRKGGLTRAAHMTPGERSEWTRKMVQARERKRKGEK